MSVKEPGRARRWWVTVALLLALAVSVAACSKGKVNGNVSSPKLDWSSCGTGRDCATLTVPLDYDHPDGRTLNLALIRIRATDSAHRIGSLLINPGGPGDSGFDLARRSDFVFGDNVLARFDIIGFDPRGVGLSFPPVLCEPPPPATPTGSPTPDSRSADDRRAATAQAYAESCARGTGDELGFVDTVSAARDIERIRIALGEDRISYFGYSYGTLLGATYADLYPAHVRAIVLDGAEDPTLTYEQKYKAKAMAYESELHAFLSDCASRTACPFYANGDPEREFDQLRARLNDAPLSATSVDGRAQRIDGTALLAAAEIGLTRGDRWQQLAQAFADADYRRDPRPIEGILRQSSAPAAANQAYALQAVNCLDLPVPQNASDFANLAREWSVDAPRFGARWAYAGFACAFWPVPAKGAPHELHAAGSAPILVVGTRGDPVTPYQWAQSLASQLRSGHLLTWNGHGHTAYGKNDTCINQAVDAYLVDLVLPQPDQICD